MDNHLGVQIANPELAFRGLTYGEWIGVWLNNLLSEKPDIAYREGKGMVFLRGNVEYSYRDPVDPTRDAFAFFTGDNRLIIQEDTAVFVPIISTMFSLGDEYQGQVMNDELSMRNTARRDTVAGGPVGCRIRKNTDNKKYGPLVKNLNQYYFETPLFSLSVPKISSYASTVETPISPGNYHSIIVGIFVIISGFPPGYYRLWFYGRGVGRYRTMSVYDIEVKPGKHEFRDISEMKYTTRGESDPMKNIIEKLGLD